MQSQSRAPRARSTGELRRASATGTTVRFPLLALLLGATTSTSMAITAVDQICPAATSKPRMVGSPIDQSVDPAVGSRPDRVDRRRPRDTMDCSGRTTLPPRAPTARSRSCPCVAAPRSSGAPLARGPRSTRSTRGDENLRSDGNRAGRRAVEIWSIEWDGFTHPFLPRE
jgi:hypothetical protein